MQNFTEPTWTEPDNIETKCENSLFFTRNPYMLTGLFVQWSRTLFKSPDNIMNEQLKDYVWDEDYQASRITIDPSYKHDSKAERRRPAVYIKRGAVSHSTPGMKGGLQTPHIDDDGFFRGKYMSSILTGSHVFQCIGDTEAEAENIANEVFHHLMLYGEGLKEASGLGSFWVAGLGETQEADGGKEYWVCPVNVTWSYTFNWTLDREAPILKEIGYITGI